ncbi:DNA-directed RNA polymerase IV subunit [Trifolium repens]|nr:DNA-directed RNA polymerase IV subunit [Trifolium repens]
MCLPLQTTLLLAANILQRNLSSATSDTGKSILHKHLHLVANSLSASGEFVGLSAKGMVRQRKHASVSSPFVQAYFSNPGSSFLKAAKSGVVDNLQGNLDALGCGNCLPMGTSGQFDIIYLEKVQELDKSVDVYGLLEASFGQMDQKMKSEDPSISEIFIQQMQCINEDDKEDDGVSDEEDGGVSDDSQEDDESDDDGLNVEFQDDDISDEEDDEDDEFDKL